MKSFSPHVSRSHPSRRLLSSSSYHYAKPSFTSGPAPPRLPLDEQKRFEDLQRSSTGAFSTPKHQVIINHSFAAANGSNPDIHTHLPPAAVGGSKPDVQINQSRNTRQQASSNDDESGAINVRVQANGEGEELHPDVRRGVKPEFEGERNPKTGETGGPKNEPLRWGGEVDWSYNGRVTDF